MRRAWRGVVVGVELDFGPELKDVKLRIRDLQGLLLQNMFQLGGPGAARNEPRVAQVVVDLLPLFAALRKADRMELAEAFVNGVVDYAIGRKTARDAVAGLGSLTRNRVTARDVAEKVKASHDANPDRLLECDGQAVRRTVRGQGPRLRREQAADAGQPAQQTRHRPRPGRRPRGG